MVVGGCGGGRVSFLWLQQQQTGCLPMLQRWPCTHELVDPAGLKKKKQAHWEGKLWGVWEELEPWDSRYESPVESAKDSEGKPRFVEFITSWSCVPEWTLS